MKIKPKNVPTNSKPHLTNPTGVVNPLRKTETLLDYAISSVVKNTMKGINVDKPNIDLNVFLRLVWKYSLRRLEYIESKVDKKDIQEKLLIVIEKEYVTLKKTENAIPKPVAKKIFIEEKRNKEADIDALSEVDNVTHHAEGTRRRRR